MNNINNNIITVKNFTDLKQNEQVKVLKNFLKTLKSADGVGKKSFERLKTFAKMYHLLPSIEAKCEVIEGIDHKIEILMRENKRYRKNVDSIVGSDPKYYERPEEPFVKELREKNLKR